ncbi:MAG: ABC transporter substrate binding protein [Elusimicrobiota bacterium]
MEVRPLSLSLFRRLLLVPFLLVGGVRLASGLEVAAALSSDSGHYRQAYEGFEEEWGSSVAAVLGGEVPAGVPDAIAAFGSRAALREWPPGSILVTCLAPGARPTHRGEIIRVELLPAPSLLVARLKKLLPRLKILRVLWSSDFEEGEVRALSEAADAQGLKIVSERVADPGRLPAVLRSLSQPADAVWLMPDPALVNAENFSILKEYSAAARVPFLAPTEGLAEKGATATLAATFRDVGRAAAAALRGRLRGERNRSPARPDRLVVTVNAAAARAAGMDLSSAEGVDKLLP